jgi:hypothetical protein
MASYDDALGELYRAPLASFVAERKRLANELKAKGDRTGARVISGRGRPPVSAWAVNQLWWNHRDAFEKLLATAARLRDGDLGGTAAHREALAGLRSLASEVLSQHGHGATEATLRRITTTLSAIAATGSFDPDPPGTLSEDRDPPGFEAAGIPGLAASVKQADDGEDEADAEDAGAKTSRREAADAKREVDAQAAAAQAHAAAERRRAEEARAKKLAERHRHEAALRTAQGDVERRKREVDRLRAAVAEAEAALEKAEAIAADLEAKLEELSGDSGG